MATPRFHALRVLDVKRETADAVSIAFDVPAGLRDDYRFDAGQYLTVRKELDGEDVRRSYSICSGPDDGELRIAVKRVDGGLFSAWANSEIKSGDVLEVMTPTGRFGIVDDAGGGRVVACFAAGSGITPVLSIIRGILGREPASRVFLFYGNRSTEDMLFREALEDLKDRHLGRLSVFPVLSREQQDVPVLNGRLDADKVRLLLRHIVPVETITRAFVCGPADMSEAVQAVLRELGLPAANVHVERFVSALGGRPRAKPAAVRTEIPFATAALTSDGRGAEVPVAEGESVLDAALRAGMDLPFACKGGMCSTCRARLVEGSVEMAVNFSLEPWEIAAGFILTCQAHPTTPRVVIDYDHV